MNKLLWIGLTLLQCQSLTELIDQEIEAVQKHDAPDESASYLLSLRVLKMQIESADTNEVTLLKTEIHDLKNKLQSCQLECSLKDKELKS